MRTYDTRHIPGASLEQIAHDQNAADQFAAFLDDLAATGWTVEHLYQVSDGLLVIMFH